MSKFSDVIRELRRGLEHARRRRVDGADRYAEDESWGQAAFVYERDAGEPLPQHPEPEPEAAPWQSLADQAAAARPVVAVIPSAAELRERIRTRLRAPDALREAIVLNEILGEPLARRRRTRR